MKSDCERGETGAGRSRPFVPKAVGSDVGVTSVEVLNFNRIYFRAEGKSRE